MLLKAIAVFTLDLDQGCALETLLSGSLSNVEREHLEASALPDTDKEGEQVFVVSLPAEPDGTAGGFAYCAFCCRRDPLAPRGYLQKALALVSPCASWYLPIFRRLSMLLARTYLDRGAAAFASAAEELAAWPPAPTGGAVQLHLAGVTALGRLPRGMPAALHHGAMEYGDGIGLLLRCPQLLPQLWALWELLLCGRPLLVHSDSAALCSEASPPRRPSTLLLHRPLLIPPPPPSLPCTARRASASSPSSRPCATPASSRHTSRAARRSCPRSSRPSRRATPSHRAPRPAPWLAHAAHDALPPLQAGLAGLRLHPPGPVLRVRAASEIIDWSDILAVMEGCGCAPSTAYL